MNSPGAKSFEDLFIFQEARRMAAGIWEITRTGAFARDRVLVDQLRRAGLSVVSNIAEGFERTSRADFARFLTMAKGSCGEARAQMLIALDQKYVSRLEYETFCAKARRISGGLSHLSRHLRKPRDDDRKIRKTARPARSTGEQDTAL